MIPEPTWFNGADDRDFGEPSGEDGDRAPEPEETMAEPKRICAWCKTVLSDGSEPATHGICRSCGDKVVAEADAPTACENCRSPICDFGTKDGESAFCDAACRDEWRWRQQ